MRIGHNKRDRETNALRTRIPLAMVRYHRFVRDQVCRKGNEWVRGEALQTDLWILGIVVTKSYQEGIEITLVGNGFLTLESLLPYGFLFVVAGG